MIKIYHNPRCSKSRQGLALVEKSQQEFEVIHYLERPLSKKEMEELIALLGIPPIDLIRKKEAIWKENYQGKELSEQQIIAALSENPKLMERPIVVKGDKAIIARPTEKIQDLLFS